MFYEFVSKVTTIDRKGNDKEISERYIIQNKELFGEVELAAFELYNGENDVIAIKRSNVREFINNRSDESQAIFFTTVEDVFIDEKTGEEKSNKYVVGLFADSAEEATTISANYLKQGMSDFRIVCVKKTKFVDLI